MPKQQIELHESLVLKETDLVIDDEAPSSFNDDLIGMMISISFKRNNNAIVKKTSRSGLRLFGTWTDRQFAQYIIIAMFVHM